MNHLFNVAYKEGFPSSFADVRSTIMKNYETVKQLMRKHFLAKTDPPSIMLDEWTSLSKKQYINLIVYFKNDKYNLGLIELSDDAIAENILLMVNTRLAEFGISTPKTLTADGARTNSKLARISNMKFQKCFNHGVHLAVTDLLYNKGDLELEDNNFATAFIPEESQDVEFNIGTVLEDEERHDPIAVPLHTGVIKDVVKKVRGICKLVLNSPKNVRKFLAKSSLLPILDVKTRWSSLCSMLERFLRIKSELNYLYVDLKLDWPLTEDEIELIRLLTDMLQPCKTFIAELSSKRVNLVTADLKIEAMFESLEAISTEHAHGAVLIKKFISILERRILERRSEMSDILMFLFGNKIKRGKRYYKVPSDAKIAEYVAFFGFDTAIPSIFTLLLFYFTSYLHYPIY